MPGDPTATNRLADAKAAAMPPKKDAPPKKETVPVDPLPMPMPKPKDTTPVPKPRDTTPIPMPKPKDTTPIPIPMPKVPMPMPKNPAPKGDPNAAKIADLLKTADAQEDGGKYVDAWRTYKEVLALAPANAEAKKRSTFCLWMEQGRKDLAAGKFAEATQNVNEALKIDPNNANAKQMLQSAKAKKKN